VDDKIGILVASRNNEDRAKILAELSDKNDFSVVGAEKDESGTIIKSEKLKPDVLVIDFHQPGISGLEIAPMIRRRSPSTIIVLLFSNDDNSSIIFNTGVSGYLSKEEDLKKIALVARAVHSGGYYFSSSIISTINQRNIIEQTDKILTPAERGIVTLIAQGYSDKEIAKQINFSLGSVKNCVNAVKNKLKVKNREQMVAYSVMYGLINLTLSSDC
jgi:DNA-binding NarL/FixJ family response regulator